MTGGVLGTTTIVLALVAPTLFVDQGAGSWAAWSSTAAGLAAAVLFVLRERAARHPLLDLSLVARPLVSSGLAYKAASGLATAGLGYLVTLQLQLDWGWSPALAAIGMLPQVVVLVAGGAFVNPFVQRVGIARAAMISAATVVAGLAVYAVLSRYGYVWVAVALVLEAAGMRVVGVVAGVNVLSGLPRDRTSLGAALVDTASEVTAASASPPPARSWPPCSPATSRRRTGTRSRPTSSARPCRWRASRSPVSLRRSSAGRTSARAVRTRRPDALLLPCLV